MAHEIDKCVGPCLTDESACVGPCLTDESARVGPCLTWVSSVIFYVQRLAFAILYLFFFWHKKNHHTKKTKYANTQEIALVCRNELVRWRFLLTATGVTSGWIKRRVLSTGMQCTSVGYSRSLWSKRVASHLKRSWRRWMHRVVRIRAMIVAVVLVGLVNAHQGKFVVDLTSQKPNKLHIRRMPPKINAFFSFAFLKYT